MTVGFWQIIIILALVFLLFGAGRLPRIMGDLAAGLKAFKKGLDDAPSSAPSSSSAPTSEASTPPQLTSTAEPSVQQDASVGANR